MELVTWYDPMKDGVELRLECKGMFVADFIPYEDLVGTAIPLAQYKLSVIQSMARRLSRALNVYIEVIPPTSENVAYAFEVSEQVALEQHAVLEGEVI